MRQPREVIAAQIKAVAEEGRKLTKWEENFIESISDQFDSCGRLSERQEEILERIYTEKVP